MLRQCAGGSPRHGGRPGVAGGRRRCCGWGHRPRGAVARRPGVPVVQSPGGGVAADPGHRGTAAGWMQSRSSSQDSDRGGHFATLRGTSGHAGFISTHCGCGCAPPPGPLLQQGQVSHKTGRRLAHDHAPTNVLRLNTSSEQRLESPCWPRSTLKDQYSQLCGIAWLSSLITPSQGGRHRWVG
jgi:hypothetical protein